MTARSWTLRDDHGRALTMNKARNLDRWTFARIIADGRKRWKALAEAADIPTLDKVTVTVLPLHVHRGAMSDVCAEAHAVKAAIDGIRDAGVIPDDNPAHVRAVTFLPVDVCGVDGFELTITEVTE